MSLALYAVFEASCGPNDRAALLRRISAYKRAEVFRITVKSLNLDVAFLQRLVVRERLPAPVEFECFVVLP